MEGPYAPCSNWSERHAAYAAGLGTFGLCDGLITQVGKAVRVGSVVAQVAVPASKRPYGDHQAYCNHDKGCRACIVAGYGPLSRAPEAVPHDRLLWILDGYGQVHDSAGRVTDLSQGESTILTGGAAYRLVFPNLTLYLLIEPEASA